MLHPLSLVKIKNRGAEHFFKPLFKVTFIGSNLAGKFFNGYRVADMFQQQFPCSYNSIAASFIFQKFALIDLVAVSFAKKAIKAVNKQKLYLAVQENILENISVFMIEKALKYHPVLIAERNDMRYSLRVLER